MPSVMNDVMNDVVTEEVNSVSSVSRFARWGATVGFALALGFASACNKAEKSTGDGAGQSRADNATAAATAGTDTIKIGEVGSMTGTEAAFGDATHKGITLAVEQINAAGGVKGKKIQVLSLDDQGRPDEASTAVTKLITQNGVSAILGEVASTNSIAMAPIAQQYKVPMISPSSTNPKVTTFGDYIFRVCFIDPFQGSVMAKFARENLKVSKVAVLEDVKSDYSKGLTAAFVESFEKLGGKIVARQSYAKGDSDYKAQLTAIRGATPEAIFVPGYYGDVALIAKQARNDLGITVPLMGGDGWDAPELKQIGGKALNNGYFSNHYSEESTDPRVQDFISAYKKAYNETPNGLAAMGYDGARILFDAMNRAPSLKNSDVRDAIAATKNFPAVTGVISMDANRNAVKPAVVMQVVDGKFKYVTTISP